MIVMKKSVIFAACIVVLMTIAYAAEDDRKEIQIMHYSFGAKVRMLQLEKSVSMNILRAENIIAEMKPRNITNTTVLEATIDEMKLIKDEIKNISYSQNASALARQFVDIKKDAIDLSKEFRDALNEILSPGQISEIRQSLNTADMHADIKQINEETGKAVCEYNAQRLSSVLNRSSVVIDKARMCEMSAAEMKSMMGSEIRANSSEMMGRMKATTAERNRFGEAAMEHAAENYQERKIERLETRAERLQHTAAKQRMKAKIAAVKGVRR